MTTERQKPISVFYKEKLVGEYFADLIADSKVIIELKAAESLIEEHELQLINYLKATDIEVGLLLNFGKKPEVRRKIFSNKNQRKSVESVAKNCCKLLFERNLTKYVPLKSFANICKILNVFVNFCKF